MIVRDEPAVPETITLSRDQLAEIIVLARAVDAQVDPVDPDDSSHAADDRGVGVLETGPDNPIGRELDAAISTLNVDAQVDLGALAWIGRGDFDDWAEARATARASRETPAARYLRGLPLLGDYLEGGAEAIGLNVGAEEERVLHPPSIEQPIEDDRD